MVVVGVTGVREETWAEMWLEAGAGVGFVDVAAGCLGAGGAGGFCVVWDGGLV